jgi:hypothetical protein
MPVPKIRAGSTIYFYDIYHNSKDAHNSEIDEKSKYQEAVAKLQFSIANIPWKCFGSL